MKRIWKKFEKKIFEKKHLRVPFQVKFIRDAFKEFGFVNPINSATSNVFGIMKLPLWFLIN